MRYRVPAFLGAGVAASALAALLGYLQKTPCSAGGAWNSFTSQFRDACYTDIYPLYYVEGLSKGQVPYYGHPVEYPVLMGWMMQAAAWMVHSVSDPYARGKDFYDVSVLLLAVCLIGGVLATAVTAYRENDSQGWKAALLTALSPGLILAAYINWDLFAMALTAGGLAAWAWQREWLAGALLGLAVATKFYPLLIFGALLLLCLRAGKLREFGKALAGAVIAWLVINVPVALTATSGWAEFYAFSRSRGADWGSIWYLFENYKVPVVGNSALGRLNLISSAAFAIAFVLIAAARACRPAAATAAAAVLPAARLVPHPEQGVVTAVRDLARPARGAIAAAAVGVRGVAAHRGRLLPRHLGLLRFPVPCADRRRLHRHQPRLVLRHSRRAAAVPRPARVHGGRRHSSAGTGSCPCVRRQRRPGGRRT